MQSIGKKRQKENDRSGVDRRLETRMMKMKKRKKRKNNM